MMSKKISIVNALDLNKLNREIDIYISKNNEVNPYLFMNKATIDALPTDTDDDFINLVNKANAMLNGIAGYYYGYKVFKDDSLNFGEVEIR